MNVIRHIQLGFAFALASCALSAQQQATTLFRLAQKADAILVATAIGASDPSPEWRRIDFRAQESLKGPMLLQFAVLEPQGRCCGASLSDAVPGRQYVMFLEVRGGSAHPIGGDRGVVAHDESVVAHLRALLQASSDQEQQSKILALALTHADMRVSQDAALALGSHPHPLTDAPSRALLAEALDHSAAVNSTALPSLACAFMRAEGDAAAQQLMPRYLAANAESAEGLRRAMESLPAARIADALRASRIDSDEARIRAADLMARKPDPIQVDVLQRLLRDVSSAKAGAAIAGALLDHDVAESSIAQHVPKAVLIAAQQRRALRAAGPKALASPPR